MSPTRNVRLSDVAAVAGVSLATASKALNGSDRVSDETRARVREVAARLDFRPNALARSFALGQSRTIGVMTRRVSSTFATPVLVGAVLQFGKQELATLVYDADVSNPRELTDSTRELRARRIDGLLVIGDGPDYLTPSVSHMFDVPVTYAYHATDDPSDLMFLPDNERIGRLATEHLVGRGRSRIAHITSDASSIAVQRRLRGMTAVLEEAGLAPVTIHHGEWTRRYGVAAFDEILASGVPIDAVFCGNDHIAFGVLDVCRARGVRVPDDLAVIGVDNWEGLIVNQPDRSLTTVDPGLRELGERAASHFLAMPRPEGEQLVAPTVIEGPST